MSLDTKTITPPIKSEAWKFSPKSILGKSTFIKPQASSLETLKEAKIAIGPSAHQFEALSFAELEEDGYVKLELTKIKKPLNSNTERAKLDSTVQDLYNTVDSLKITFLKPLPSNLWISPVGAFRSAEFNLPNGINQNICIFESESTNTNADGFLFNFNLSDNSNLELGVSLNNNKASLSQINVETQKGSHANIFSLLSGETNYKRLEVNVYQEGPESELSLNGICFSKKLSTLEFHSNIFHLNKNQPSTQIYKSICSDQGKAIFGGRIHLTENAAGADVKQLNNNLILGKKSSVDTQPELNIYQDDVKASHGATTSTIDDDHLFYFASRGFKPEQSRQMLLEAFCTSAFGNLKATGFIDYFSDAVNTELDQGFENVD